MFKVYEDILNKEEKMFLHKILRKFSMNGFLIFRVRCTTDKKQIETVSIDIARESIDNIYGVSL